MERLRDGLRSGDWLTRERVRLVAVALLMASAFGFLFLVVTAHGAVDRQGRPLGTDFSNVYAAGTFVNEHNADAPFDPPTQFARERAIFGDDTQFYGWHYPPFFLFVAAALALLPYGLALAVWQTVTLGLYLLVIGAILRPSFQGARSASPESIITNIAMTSRTVVMDSGQPPRGFRNDDRITPRGFRLDRAAASPAV